MTSAAPKALPPCAECGGHRAHTFAEGEHARARVCACVERCAACGGRRHRFEKNERGYVVAVPCACQAVIERVERYCQVELPARYHAATLDGFEERTRLLRELKYELLTYRDQFHYGDAGYVLWGPPGTGKTHLIAALLGYFALERGLRCRFIDFGYLTTLIKQGYSAGKAENEIIDGLVAIPVLAVDELGKGRGNEWELTVLDALVNRRYNAGLSTFFTTNFAIMDASALPGGGSRSRLRASAPAAGPQPLQSVISQAYQRTKLGTDTVDRLRTNPALQTLEDRVGSRIYSRLFEMCVIRELDGGDMRRQAPPKGMG